MENGKSSKAVKKDKKKKRLKKVEKVTIAEDFCFRCTEGGCLVMCDFKNCSKVYHVECLKLSVPPKGIIPFQKMKMNSSNTNLIRSVDMSLASLRCVWSQVDPVLYCLSQFPLFNARLRSGYAISQPTWFNLQRTFSRGNGILCQTAHGRRDEYCHDYITRAFHFVE